ncbi:hypothetical protein GCM10009827_058960 [Dactylosporangium maewongense]|uniref:DUF1963 domain-containing protein n=1 Tax=Dactylosporangium maewongense TaxID=634393 RepID=A0ABN2B578_9ACTN
MPTTPPPPVDVTALVPALAAYARQTVRLHPRPGAPTAADSSLGGPLAWPLGEPWPYCHPGRWDHTFDDAPREPVPFVPVLQVYARDAPQLPYPPGTDLLQVTWCPFDHNPYSAPIPRLDWRDSAGFHQPAAIPVPHHASPRTTVPAPCSVSPEPVLEYPSWDLPRDLYYAIRSATPYDFDAELSVAPGTKLGGYPSWCQLPEWPACPACGTTMEHLATVASLECDPGGERWLPAGSRLRQPSGLMLGDVGSIYLFTCTACPHRPYESVFQNS